jgi:hypothetical protein
VSTDAAPTLMTIGYNRHELCLQTVDGGRGQLTTVEIDGEIAYLLRTPEGIDKPSEVRPYVLASAPYYAERFGYEGPAKVTGWGIDAPGTSGVWTATSRAPEERDAVSSVFTIGPPPLGATRGRREGETRDFRWVYLRLGDGPVEPLKRYTAMRTELRRVLRKPESWGRVAMRLRLRPELLLKLTPDEPRAALLVSTTDRTGPPCLLRCDFDMLINWLDRQERTPTS